MEMLLHVGKHFRVRERLGGGSFGDIYKGQNTITQEEIAIKVEKNPTKSCQLLNESKVYKLLSGAVGIPNIRYFGNEETGNIMVMDLLGKSLEVHFESCQKHFSLKTVLMIADQLITRIEYLHNKNFIHRDIKPENFIMGVGKNANQVFIIDMGLSKRYCDPITREHIAYSDNRPLVGTARYTSINTHEGIEQSRRDDLEGIAYLLIHFLRGSLPWQSIKADDKKEKYRLIHQKKAEIPACSLCDGLPKEFCIFLDSIRSLEFSEQPKYYDYKKLFRDLFIREGFIYDCKYDWITEPKPNSSEDYRIDNQREATSYQNRTSSSTNTPFSRKPSSYSVSRKPVCNAVLHQPIVKAKSAKPNLKRLPLLK